MNAPVPHYLLFSEASNGSEPGHWRFVLRSADGADRLVVDDVEPDVRGERLELLTVVRGLEALDQPSHVTIVTPSVYVRKGIEYGISEWRKNGWRWEFFGEMVPVKDNDLWQRVERAMQFHQLQCRTLRFDAPHGPARPAGRGWTRSKEPGKAASSPSQSVSSNGPDRTQETGAPSKRPWRRQAGRSERLASPSKGLHERWQGRLAACRRVFWEVLGPWPKRVARLHASFAPAFGLMRLF